MEYACVVDAADGGVLLGGVPAAACEFSMAGSGTIATSAQP